MLTRDFINQYLDTIAPNRLKASTLYCARSALATWSREIGDIPLADLTRARILSFRDTYSKPATANRMISVLSSCLAHAVERELIDVNPCRGITPLRVNNRDVGRLISDADERAMLENSTGELHTTLRILFATGCRLGEVEKLTRADIDTTNKTIIFRDTKSGHDRYIPISADLATHLKKHRMPGAFKRGMYRGLMRRLNLTYRVHDIRHTYITRAINAGIDPLIVGRLVGHASVGMTARYTRPNVEQLRRHIDRLGA